MYDILLVDCEDTVLVEVDKDMKGHVHVVAIFNIYVLVALCNKDIKGTKVSIIIIK